MNLFPPPPRSFLHRGFCSRITPEKRQVQHGPGVHYSLEREVVEYQDTPFPAIVRLWRAYNGRGASPVLCLQLGEIVLPLSLSRSGIRAPSDPLLPPSLFLSISTPPPNVPTFSFLDFGLKRKGRIRPRSICPRKRLVNPRNPPQSSRRYANITARNKFLVALTWIWLLGFDRIISMRDVLYCFLIHESIIFDGNISIKFVRSISVFS